MTDSRDNEDLVFLSYVRADEGRVVPIYESLTRKGFNLWFDRRRLRPGQNWDFEIRRALDKSALVIVFISHNSVDHRGYVQREIKMALEKLAEKLVDDIYLVPVLLDDDVTPPDELKSRQYARLSDDRFDESLADAITYQLGRLGVELIRTQREQDVYWSPSTIREEWEGLPGYEVELQLLQLRSEKYANVAEVAEYIKGDLLAHLFRHRRFKLVQSPQTYNFGQDRFLRTNTFAAHTGEPATKGKALTIRYSISWYGAGAAHPNYYYHTYSFILEPLLLVPALSDMFVAPDDALLELQEVVRDQLSLVRVKYREEDEGTNLDPAWIERGTAGWGSFSSFLFGHGGLELYFEPYQVGPYSAGRHSAIVPYEAVLAHTRPEYRSALGI